jgi:hypothetical protein
MANLFPAQFSRLSAAAKKKANQQKNRRGLAGPLDEEPHSEVVR